MRDVLGVDVGSVVAVTTDGNRLLLEPTGASEERAFKPVLDMKPWHDPRIRNMQGIRDDADAELVWRSAGTLRELHARGFSQDDLERLCSPVRSRFSAKSSLLLNKLGNASAVWTTDDFGVLERIQECWQLVQNGCPLHEAVDCVKPRSPAADAASEPFNGGDTHGTFGAG